MPYDTPLSPQQYAQYLRDMGARSSDTRDYDMQGAWMAGQRPQGDSHFTDQFKKPNHPTFSQESQYSTPEQPGGRWADAQAGNVQNTFTPSDQMYADKARMAALVKYLKGPAERGKVLMVPPTISAPAEDY